MDITIRGMAVVFAAGLGCGMAAPAAALNWQLGEAAIDLNTRVSSGVSLRTLSADPAYIGIANGGKAYSNNVDDGELAFPHAGDVVYATQKITSSLTASWKGFGVFGRASYFYDPVLHDKNFFNDANYGPGKEYGYDVVADKERQDHRHVGSGGKMLDLYVFGNFDIAHHSLNFKLGQQVINWGESTFVQNGLNSLVSLDANKARVPGAEISEFAIPVPQLFAAFGLTDRTSIEGFYQWAFRPTLPDAAGTFFPVTDQDFTGLTGGNAGDISFGRAPENSVALTDCSRTGGNIPGLPTCVPFGGTIPRGADRLPRGGGQYGGAFRFSLPFLNDLDAALYAATYHDRLPLYSTSSVTSTNVAASTARYFAEFPEDVHLYGFSFNTSLPWGIALQGEYSYRPNQPLQLGSVELELTALGAPSQLDPVAGQAIGGQYIRGFRRKKVSQLDFGLTKILGGSNWFGYDQLTLVGEVAADRVHDLEQPSVLAYEGPSTWLPDNSSTARYFGVPQQQGGYPTAGSWGYKLLARATYDNVLLGGLTLEPALRFDHDVAGITPQPLGNFVRNSRVLTPSLGWRYRDYFTGELSYASHFGGGQANLLRDRDLVSIYLRYAF